MKQKSLTKSFNKNTFLYDYFVGDIFNLMKASSQVLVYMNLAFLLSDIRLSFSRTLYLPYTMILLSSYLAELYFQNLFKKRGEIINYKLCNFLFVSHGDHCVKIIQMRNFFWSRFFLFSPNMGKYGPEKTLYLDTFHAVANLAKLQCKQQVEWRVSNIYRYVLSLSGFGFPTY